MSVFIADGYTLTATAHSAVGDLKITYRPALHEERVRLRWLDTEDQIEATNAMLANHIVDWDAKDANGNRVPRTADAVRRLHPSLYAQVLNFVLGYTVPATPNTQSQDEIDSKN